MKLHCIVLALAALFYLMGHAAGEPLVVKIDTTDVKLSLPEGMVDLPKDDPIVKAAQNLVPDDCILLRSCITSTALDPTAPDPSKNNDPTKDIMSVDVFAMKDAPMDIEAGDFIDFVSQVAFRAAHSVLISQYSGFDYDDAQKRLDQFAKETGIGVRQDGDVYSLGMVSRSVACVSYMATQYLKITYKDEKKRIHCVSVIGYVRLNKKVVVVTTSLNQETILQDDLRALKHFAERYQIDLQNVNNP